MGSRTRRPSRGDARGPAAGLGTCLRAACVAAGALLGAAAGAQAEVGAEPRDYRVECDKERQERPDAPCGADVATYVGWRVYRRHCATCHAEDGLGSSFAPSLVDRVRRLDRRAFYAALDDGYLGRSAGMPPWGENPEVARYYAELWSYLNARASGGLPPGPLLPLRADQ